MPGDVNRDNKVDVADLVALARALAGMDSGDGYDLDVNEDGSADIFDLIALRKLLAE